MNYLLFLVGLSFLGGFVEGCQNCSNVDPTFENITETVKKMAKSYENVNSIFDQMTAINFFADKTIVDLMNAAKNADLLSANTSAFILELVQYAYQFSEYKKQMNDKQENDLKNNPIFQNYEKQRTTMFRHLLKLHSSVIIMSGKIAEPSTQNLFLKSVTFYYLLQRYQTMSDSYSNESMTLFVNQCRDTDPLKPISTIASMAYQILLPGTTFQFNETQFFAGVNMYHAILNQFYFFQPFCSKFGYNSSIDSITLTITLKKDIAIKAMKNVVLHRLSLSLDPKFLHQLIQSVNASGEIPDDSDKWQHAEDRVERVYNALTSTFASINDFISENNVYYVVDEKNSDSKITLPNQSTYLGYARSDDFLVVSARIPETPSTCQFSDEAKGEFCSTVKKSSNFYEGANIFMDKFCPNRTFMFTSFVPASLDYSTQYFMRRNPQILSFELFCVGSYYIYYA